MGWTQQHVAYLLNASQPAVNQWEKGIRTPTDKNKAKIERVSNGMVRFQDWQPKID